MKSQLLILLSFVCIANFTIAQTKKTPVVKTEKIKVWGNCGMCKNNIEKAAKAAGASYALWSEESKLLIVKFDAAKTTTANIEKKVASVGYDTENETAATEVYNKLHGCCQYERKKTEADDKNEAVTSCCTKEKSCTKDSCKKAEMKCCVTNGCSTTNCCNVKEGNAKACCTKDKKCSEACSNKADKSCCTTKSGTIENCCNADAKCCSK